MPKLQGTEFAKKAIAIRPDVNILLLTGHEGAISEAEAKASGIREVLAKPLTQAELEAAIRRVFE